VARRENAALTHEAETSIQPDEAPPGGHLEGGDVDGLHVSSELLTDDVVLQQLPCDPVGVGLRFVALVDRHDDGD